MKGNFKLKGSFLLVFFLFCCLKSTSGLAQCNNGIYLKEIVKSVSGQDNGTIAVNVEAAGDYECFLYRLSGSGYELVEKIKGVNSKLIEFKNLPAYNSYTVRVNFHSEEDILCAQIQLSDLSTIEL